MPVEERTSGKVILNLTRRGAAVGLSRTVHRRWPFLVGAEINTSKSLSFTVSNTQRRFILKACHIYRAFGQYQAISVGWTEYTFWIFYQCLILSFCQRFALQNPLWVLVVMWTASPSSIPVRLATTVHCVFQTCSCVLLDPTGRSWLSM